MNINLLLLTGSFLISAICGLVFTPVILNYSQKRGLYDIPNSRKIHNTPIPRLGGLCFLPSMFLAFIITILVRDQLTSGHQIELSLWTIIFPVSVAMIYVVGLVDDIFGVGAKTKFVVQIIASTFIPLSGLYINNLYGFCGIDKIPFWIGAPLTVFILVFIDNAMNLIDGIDGLCASLSFIALLGFLICFFNEDMLLYCILIAGLMGVLAAYFYFNVFGRAEKNRKIFMGDCGSLTLGLILGFLFLKLTMYNPTVVEYHNYNFPVAYSLLIVPVFDTVRVILYRLRHRLGVFVADKNHIYHKLMRAGLTQHQALVVIISLALFMICLNLILQPLLNFTVVVIIDVLVYTAFHLVLNRIIIIKKQRASMKNSNGGNTARDVRI